MRLTRPAQVLTLALPLLVFSLLGLWLLRTVFAGPSALSYAEFTRLLEAGRGDPGTAGAGADGGAAAVQPGHARPPPDLAA